MHLRGSRSGYLLTQRIRYVSDYFCLKNRLIIFPIGFRSYHNGSDTQSNMDIYAFFLAVITKSMLTRNCSQVISSKQSAYSKNSVTISGTIYMACV